MSKISKIGNPVIKHIRATGVAPGRFLTYPSGDVSSTVNHHHRLSAYRFPYSTGTAASYETVKSHPSQYKIEGDVNRFKPGEEVRLDASPDILDLISPMAPASDVPVAAVEYVLRDVEGGGVVMDVYNSYVPEELRGKGLGKDILKEVASYAEKHGFDVIASCPYAHNYFQKETPSLIKQNLKVKDKKKF